ncbi:putative non-LTR retrolelement reverse transcriptase, partial [Trifolium medium]|nr:putative non-LTR retrolelement reverse transcriptase [Trifolium medium]
GRSIHENIVVAQELLHSMNRMSGKTGYFAIKVDLAKAYDMLRWDFIHKTLQEVGLPPGMIEVIMHGVATAVADGKWLGIRAGREGPTISHLMFADDLLLFGKATTEHMKCVIKVLNDFCMLSGQQVSQEKTSILFSKNVPQEVKTMLQHSSGFRVTSSLGEYLGVPLTGRAPKRVDYQYIIEQLQNKLTAWKAKNLSFAGRVTLAKSVMEAVPIYPMMTASIPNSILQEVQRLQRDFIWGDTINGRKHHAVRWELISTPKDLGGLGLRRLDIMNKACLMKLGWELNQNGTGMWSAILRGKYGRGSTILVNAQAKNNDSSLWRMIVLLQQDIDRFSCWAIGDGIQVHAWESCWIEPGLRICDLNVNIPITLMHATVSTLSNDAGEWNWELLTGWLPENIMKKLYAIPPPCAEHGTDIKVWPAGKNDRFSVN